ncbi:MAG: 4-hydroxybutyrate dehydrogenase, partial [Planctomycetes bacterium]|nr:4-hydroxybutyrate dehydrogenase [Planctomycetota bacterium]
MKMLQIKPSVFMFKTCQEFVDAYDIKDSDLVITNKYIYDPFFGKMGLKCHVLYQEEYGLGEPSDEMAEAIYAAMPKNVKRIIAIGGGTIIDISKLYALKNVSPILELY